MKKNSQYFRDLGWAQLKGRWEAPVLFTLVYVAISAVASAVLSGIGSLLVLPVGYSYVNAFLEDKRTAAGFKAESLFDGYKDFLRIFGTLVLEGVYTFLWTDDGGTQDGILCAGTDIYRMDTVVHLYMRNTFPVGPPVYECHFRPLL